MQEGSLKHLEINYHEPALLSCSKCGSTFVTKTKLQNHELVCCRTKELQMCHCCSKSFLLFSSLQEHLQNCHKWKETGLNLVIKGINIDGENDVDKKFVCDLCRLRFSAELYLSRHLTMHTFGLKFGCKNCGLGFAEEKTLNSHLRKHVAGKGECLQSQIPCPIDNCADILPSMKAYKFHVLREHSNSVKKYPCPKCGKFFSKWCNVLRHLKVHLNVKNYECKECGNKFTYKIGLTCHIRHAHTGERPFKCGTCSMAFAMKSDLNRHKLKHSDERKFRCADCGKRYKSKNSLRLHVQNHSGEKPWQCGVCDKRFSSKSGLNSHMATHSKIKLFECEICFRQFSSRNSIIAHIRSHAGITPFSCKFCGKKFSYPNSKTRHEKTIHAHLS